MGEPPRDEYVDTIPGNELVPKLAGRLTLPVPIDAKPIQNCFKE